MKLETCGVSSHGTCRGLKEASLFCICGGNCRRFRCHSLCEGSANQRCYDPERRETGYCSCPACGGRKPAGAGVAVQGWGGAEGISSSFSAVRDLKRLLASQVGMLRMQMDVRIWSPGKKFGDLDWRNLI